MITLAASSLSPEAESGAQLHGVPLEEGLKEEQPYHRHAAWLFAMGADTAGVAEALSVTPHAVRQWLKTPWFQQRVTQLMKENGGKDLTQLFINESFATFAVMVELRDNPKVSAAVRKSVCSDILDRVLGKPTQRVENVNLPGASADPLADAAALAGTLRNVVENLNI